MAGPLQRLAQQSCEQKPTHVVSEVGVKLAQRPTKLNVLGLETTGAVFQEDLMGGRGQQYKDTHQPRAAYPAPPRGRSRGPSQDSVGVPSRTWHGSGTQLPHDHADATPTDHHLGPTVPGAGRKLSALSYRLQRKETESNHLLA